jgi:hypothetical protein
MTDIWKTKVTKFSNKNPSDKKLTENMLFVLKKMNNLLIHQMNNLLNLKLMIYQLKIYEKL